MDTIILHRLEGGLVILFVLGFLVQGDGVASWLAI
jgi:hypothetical protein